MSWSSSRILISSVYAHDSQTVAPALIFLLDSRVLLPTAYLISTPGCLIIVKSEISTNSWILPSKLFLAYTHFRQWLLIQQYSDTELWNYPWPFFTFHIQSTWAACWLYLQNILHAWPYSPTLPLPLKSKPASLDSTALD